MKYYIVREDNQLILFKVEQDLIVSFEKEHLQNVLAQGNSLMEAFLDFEQGNYNWQDFQLDSSSGIYR